MMFGGFGLVELAIFGLFGLNALAFWRILPRAGIARYWGLAAFFPVMVFVFAWILAFRQWPGDQEVMS